jgi:hypothetical protein
VKSERPPSTRRRLRALRSKAVSSIGLLLVASFFTAADCGGGTVNPPPADGGRPDVEPVEAGAQWRPVLENLDQSLLSIWGTSERDVWAVGGPLGNEGFESLVLRFDGTTWRRAPAGKTETFWWLHGTSPSDVWLVGEKGRITHWDGAAFTEIPSGTDATLFGVWAAAPDDAWAVGGLPDQPNGTNDVVLHWDGTSWKPEVLPEQKKVALFKVWGSSANDLYVVGEAGIVWHRTNGAWKREAEGIATGRLTTVAGCSSTEIYAVGGRDLLVSNGTEWKRAEIDPLKLLNDLNGVSCASGRVVVVGGGSLKLRLVAGTWESDFGSTPFTDLHGAWVDPSGAFWGAGGQFAAAARPGAKRQGVIARYATDVVPGILAP